MAAAQYSDISSTSISNKLAQYNSDTDNDAEPIEEPTTSQKKTRGKAKKYLLHATYESKKEAEEAMKSINGKWTYHQRLESDDGVKIKYNCKKDCPKKLYIFLHGTDLKASIFVSMDNHQHMTQDQGRGLNIAQKALVEELFDAGVKRPEQVLSVFEQRKLEQPVKSRLVSFLKQVRKKKYGNYSITLDELLDWCKARENVPTDLDTVYCGNYEIREIDDDEENNEGLGYIIRIFFTTRRLIQLHKSFRFQHLCADGTYKLVWQGYPVLIVGSTDKNKAFHPFGLALCTNETSEDFAFIFNSLKKCILGLCQIDFKPIGLVADGSQAITNGFIQAFGSVEKRVMCWAHMIRKVDEHLASIKNEKHKKALRFDIEVLQLSRNPQIFDAAVKLFIAKWISVDQSINKFIEYFEDQWVKKLPGWYEGVSVDMPSTNNGLEATNRVIKDDHTFRNRMNVGEFLSLIETKLAKKWSYNYDSINPNCVNLAMVPTISLSDWTNAYQWIQEKKEVQIIKITDETSLYFIPADDAIKITKKMAECYIDAHNNCTWKDFDSYTSSESSMWCVNINRTDWKLSHCNCPSYLKNNLCKHSIGISARMKLTDCVIPMAAKQIPLGQKRKRGAPKKAQKALIIQK